MKIHPVRAGLAGLSWLAVLYMAVVGLEVPGELWAIASVITGFYFGSAVD